MKEQLFGIEIEMTGISRRMVAGVLAEYFDSSARHIGGYYDVYEIEDSQGRDWKVMSDSSISPFRKYVDEPIDHYKIELVSPICNYNDIEAIQEIVRNIRKEGGKVIVVAVLNIMVKFICLLVQTKNGLVLLKCI